MGKVLDTEGYFCVKMTGNRRHFLFLYSNCVYSTKIIIFVNVILLIKGRMDYENTIVDITPTKDENDDNRIEISVLETPREIPRRPIPTYGEFMRSIVARFFQGSILPLRRPIYTASLITILYGFFIYGLAATIIPVSSDAILSGVNSPGFPNNLPLQYKLITGYPGCVDMRMEVWRVFTYQFIHLSFMHIFTNGLSILVYGFLAESYLASNYARLQTVLAYEFGVILGVLGQVYIDGYHRIIGSSAGAYGLIGLTTSMMLSGDTTPFGEFAILNTLPTQLVVDLVYFTVLYTPAIAYTAHFGGFIAGLAVGNTFYIFSKKNKWTNWDKFVCISGVALGVFEIVFLVYHYVVDFPPRFHINPTFDKPYSRLACCLDAYYLLAGNNSMTMDSIRNNYKCIDEQLVLD
jgi:membrane associated rhomboid family serine protease